MRGCGAARTSAPLTPHPAAAAAQVAGLNFKLKATVNGDKAVVITAFRALPHAGGGVEVKAAELVA
jgi:hypothetical protein